MNKDFTKLKGILKRDRPLKDLTSWKIGGKAEYFYSPRDKEDFAEVLKEFKNMPVTVLGAATNVLIRDSGINGLVIYLRDSLKDIEKIGDNVRVEAGVRLSGLVRKLAGLGMVDASFMAGIPGTLGGALKMNAGAYGDSIWNYVKSVELIDRSGKIKTKEAKEFVFSYRKIEGLNQDEWFLGALLNFNRGDIKEAEEKVKSYLEKRSNAQPLDLPNCGSVFRNPKNDYAARLIEECGFKGNGIGGAKVSEKHANFIVNFNNASAGDVEELIEKIVVEVEKTSGIKLIPEVEILGGV